MSDEANPYAQYLEQPEPTPDNPRVGNPFLATTEVNPFERTGFSEQSNTYFEKSDGIDRFGNLLGAMSISERARAFDTATNDGRMYRLNRDDQPIGSLTGPSRLVARAKQSGEAAGIPTDAPMSFNDAAPAAAITDGSTKTVSEHLPWVYGMFGDSWGILTPEERMAEVKTRRQETLEQIGLHRKYFDQAQRAVDGLASDQGTTEYGYAVGMRDAAKKKLAEFDREIKRYDLIEKDPRMPGLGLNKGMVRSGVENATRAVLDTAISSTIKAAGWAAGYSGRVFGSDDSPDDNAIYEAGKTIASMAEQAFPGDVARQQDFSQKLAQGAGSMTAFMGTGALGYLMAGPNAGLGLMALSGGIAQGSQEFDLASQAIMEAKRKAEDTYGPIQFTPTERDRMIATGWGFLLGTSEVVPFMGRSAGVGLRGVAGNAGRQSIEEAGQEAAQTLGANIGARMTYDPSRGLGDEVGEGAAVGFVLGGLMGGLTGYRSKVPDVQSSAVPEVPSVPAAGGVELPPGMVAPTKDREEVPGAEQPDIESAVELWRAAQAAKPVAEVADDVAEASAEQAEATPAAAEALLDEALPDNLAQPAKDALAAIEQQAPGTVDALADRMAPQVAEGQTAAANMRAELERLGIANATTEEEVRQILAQRPSSQAAPAQAPPDPAVARLTAYLDGGGSLAKSQYPAAARALGVRESDLTNLLDQAVSAGALRKVGNRYRRTPSPAPRTPQAVVQTVDEVVKKLAPILPQGTVVKSFADLKDLPIGSRGRLTQRDGRVEQDDRAIEAFEQDGTIYLAEYALDKEGRLSHEVLHALVTKGLISPAEVALLADRAQQSGVFTPAMEEQYRAAYAGRANLDELIAEEAAAALVESRADGATYGKKLDTILDRILAFFKQLGSLLRRRGYRTADDVLAGFYQGDIARRWGRQDWQRDQMFAFASDEWQKWPAAKTMSLSEALVAKDEDFPIVIPGVLRQNTLYNQKQRQWFSESASKLPTKSIQRTNHMRLAQERPLVRLDDSNGYGVFRLEDSWTGEHEYFLTDPDGSVAASAAIAMHDVSEGVKYVSVARNGQGLASALYDAIDRDKGTAIPPSGEFMSQEIIRFWLKRNPQALARVLPVNHPMRAEAEAAALKSSAARSEVGDTGLPMFALADLADRNNARLIDDIGPNEPHPGRVLAIHGTTNGFDRFDVRRSRDGFVHFGTLGQSGRFVGLGGNMEEGRQIPVVLDLPKVVDVPDLMTWPSVEIAEVVEERLPEAAGLTQRVRAQIANGPKVVGFDGRHRPSEEALAAAKAYLKSELTRVGIDGLRYRNEAEGEGWSYMVWEPGKVRSATAPDNVMFAFAGDKGLGRLAGNSSNQRQRSGANSLQTIATDLARDLDLIVRPGLSKTAAGRAAKRAGLASLYNPATGVIRVQSVTDIEALGEASADALQARFGQPMQDLLAAQAAELVPDVPTPTDAAINSAFRSWFRDYLISPSLAETNAPTLFDEVEAFLDAQDPTLVAKLNSTQDAIQAYYQADPARFMEGVVRDATKPGLWAYWNEQRQLFGVRGALSIALNQLYTATIAGKDQPFATAVWEALRIYERNTGSRIDIAAAENAAKLIRLAPHSHAWAARDMEDGVKPYGGITPRGPGLIDALVMALGTDRAAARDVGPGSNYRKFGSYLVATYAGVEWTRFRDGTKPATPTVMPPGAANADQAIAFYERVAQAYETANPEFATAANLVYDFQQELLTLQKDAGFISQETFDELIKDRTYVPFYRAFDEDGDLSSRALGSGPNGLLKRKRGSERDIIDPIAGIAQKVFETRQAIALNDVKKQLLRVAEQAGPGGGVIAERVEAKELKGQNIDLEQAIESAARDAGIDPRDKAQMIDVMRQVLGNDALATYYTQRIITPGREPIVFFFEGGAPQAMRLGDGEHGHRLAAQMFEVLNTFGKAHLDMIVEIAALPAQTTRLGITTHPEFAAANLVRDALMAFQYDPKATPLYTQLKGIVDVARGAEYVRGFYRTGGMMGGEGTSYADKFRMERDIRALVARGYTFKLFDTLPNLLNHVSELVEVRNWKDRAAGGIVGAVAGAAVAGPVGAVTGGFVGATAGATALVKLGEISETATRARLWKHGFDRAIEQGLDPVAAGQEAAFWAHDYTDYSRRGSKMDGLAAVIPFLNANLQGNDVYIRRLLGKGDQGYNPGLLFPLYRAGILDATKLTPRQQQDLGLSAWTWSMTVMGLGTASAIIAMMWDDDERLKDIDDQVKASHWLIPIGDTIYRVPKPFQTVWFSQMIERWITEGRKNNPRWFEHYLEDLWSTWKPPIVPAAAEVVGTMTGYDISSGRPIMPAWNQDKSVGQQYDAYTSPFAKWAGPQMSVAPFYVDHVIHKFGATWGRTFTSLNVPGTAWYDPKKPIKGPEEEFISRRFLWQVGRGSEAGQAIREMMGGDKPLKIISGLLSAPYSKYATSATDYRALMEKPVPDHAGAVARLETMTAKERGFALLEGHFRGQGEIKYRLLHPMNRAERVARETMKIEKEIIGDELLTGKKGKNQKEVPLSPSEKKAARDILTQYRMMEMHNALVLTEETGWAGKMMFNTKSVLAELKAASPATYKEMTARFDKAGVLSGEGIAAAWPKFRTKLEDPKWIERVRKNRLAGVKGIFEADYQRAKSGRAARVAPAQSDQEPALVE